MFKVLIIAILVSFYGNSQNFVSISDKNFADFLNDKYPSCMNGNNLNISCSEILNEETLVLNSMKIENIDGIEYFVNLKVLECLENDLKTISKLPNSLIKLDCSMNQLTNLPRLPSKLEELSCALNQLKKLPVLPSTLKILYCNFNEIAFLPILPTSLEFLACGSNQITCLPELPLSIFIGDIALNPLNCVPSFESWMDKESLNLQLCEKDEISNPNHCICISSSLMSIDRNENIESNNVTFNSSLVSQNQVNSFEIIDGQEVLVYPNPTSGSLSIKSNLVIDEYSIMDIEGKIVLKNRLKNNEMNNLTQIKIDISELINGIYFIQITIGDKISTNKVFKIN